MIDFACKQFNLKDIIKCGLGLTKAEYTLFECLVKERENWVTTEELSKKLELNLSTIQRGVKKLHDKKIIRRMQNNLESGGYIYIYKANNKKEIRKLIMVIINSWMVRVEKELDIW